jgi:hypothetical protein
MEKRFDVRVPTANTTLLEHLSDESVKTGIVESRLIVQYATRYVEMTKGGAFSLMTPIAQVSANGHSEAKGDAIQPSLDGASLDTMFGDPD